MATHFTLGELCSSSAAASRGIDNTPPPQPTERLHRLMDKLLDPLRELWGKPIKVNSGYRSPVLNKVVGGASSSQHMRGEAADITAGSCEANRRLFDLLRTSNLDFDQLIDEKSYKWLHVSFSNRNRRQILHL